MWILIIAVAFILLVVIVGVSSDHKVKKREAELNKQGLSYSDYIQTGKYICGHPMIDNPILRTVVLLRNGLFDIYKQDEIDGFPQKVAEINSTYITAVNIEDASTIEKKVTLGRMALIGIFAFAAKKKVKHELAYVVLQWNDGKFDHETMFEFEGKDAHPRANECRNRIMRSLSQ